MMVCSRDNNAVAEILEVFTNGRNPAYTDLMSFSVMGPTAYLLKWVNILEPSNFFIPDVWQNYNASIVNAKEWSKIQLPKGVTKVAVIQAEDKSKVGLCYQTYRDLGYEKIAFSYGADYYKTLSNELKKNSK